MYPLLAVISNKLGLMFNEYDFLCQSDYHSSIRVHKSRSKVNTATIRLVTMEVNIVSTHCYLSVTLSHGFHPVDGNECTFAHSVKLYERFSSFGWKPMKSKLLLKGTVGGLHGSDVNGLNWFRPLNDSVATYRLVKCQYLFSGPSHFTMRLVWNQLLKRNIVQMFSDEKFIPALFLSY